MAINFSSQVYEPNYNVFARNVTFTPVASQPNQPAYAARGIYGTQPTDVMAEDGSVISDQRTILDIREAEFTVVPIQNDLVDIPADAGMPAEGLFQVIDSNRNGGGETTLIIRKVLELP